MVRHLVISILSLTLLLMIGCQGDLSRSVEATHSVDKTVAVVGEKIDEATTEYEAGGDPRPHLREAKEQLYTIRKQTASARKAMTGLEEKEDPTVRNFRLLMYLGLIGGAIFLVVYFGFGKVIRPILHNVGLLIPRMTRSEAKFDAEALRNGGNVSEARERIAARRVTDTAYDSAFKTEQSRLAKETHVGSKPVVQ